MASDATSPTPDEAVHEAASLRSDLFDSVCREVDELPREVLEQVLTLAVELAREGREGRKVGTIFVVGDSVAVLERSRCLILDPLEGHPPEDRLLHDSETRETLKELAQLDGAFVVSAEGVALSAARYLDTSSKEVELPTGLGSRHMAAASMTRHTASVAVVVSESSVVRVFHEGRLVSEVIPEIWMLSRYHVLLETPYDERTLRDVTVLSRTD